MFARLALLPGVAAITVVAMLALGVPAAGAPNDVERTGDAAARASAANTQTPTGAATAAAPGSTSAAAPGEEVRSLRTRYSRTYQGRDGTLRAVVSPWARHYRDKNGRWANINSKLTSGRDADGQAVPAGFAAQNTGNRYRAAFPDSSGEPVRIVNGRDWVQTSLVGGQGKLATNGSTATYRNALPSTSVAYAAGPDSVKETLTLADPQAPEEFSYRLELAPGMRPKLRGGNVALLRGGKPVGSLQAPFLVDANGATSGAVKVTLDQTPGGGWRLTQTPDANWLGDTDRAWPVKVDPDVTLGGPYTDCFIRSAQATSSFCSNQNLKVGYDGGKYRSLLDFPGISAAIPPDSQVLSADLSAKVSSATTSTATSITAHPLTTDWTSAVTWNTHDGTNNWTTAGGDFAANPNAVNASVGDTTGNFEHWYPTDVVADWVDKSSDRFGFLLKQTGESTSNVVSFTSWEASNPANWPTMTIRYAQNTGDQPWFSFTSQGLTDRSGFGVNNANENLLVTAEDVQVRGVGLPLGISRFYNSQDYHDGPLGPRWRLSVGPDVRLEDQPSGDVVFYAPSSTPFRFKKNGGSFDSPAGLNAKLTGAGTSGNPYKVTYNQTGQVQTFDDDGVSGGPYVLKKDADHVGNEITYAYSGGLLDTITDTQGRVITAGYDSSGLLETLTENGTGAATREWTYDYGTNDNLISYTDPEGETTTYDYDGDQLERVTDPEGNETEFAMTGSDRVTSVTRIDNPSTGSGEETFFTRTAEVTSGSDPCFVDADTPRGKTVVTDPKSGQTKHCFDYDDRVVRALDQLDHMRERTFSANSEVASVTDAVSPGNTTNFTYSSDGRNNLDEIQAPDTAGGGAGSGRSETFTYGTAGGSAPEDFQPTSKTDTEGNCTSYGYNSNRQLTTVDSGNTPSGGSCPTGGRESVNEYEMTTSHGTCGSTSNAMEGELCSTTDPGGKTTTYTYDNDGNLIKVTPPAPLGHTDLTVDELGRSTNIQDGVSGGTPETEVTPSYDKNDRIIQLNYDGTSPGSPPSCSTSDANAGDCIAYTYDGAGNLTSRKDNTGTTTFDYDHQNRVTTKTADDPSGTPIYSTSVGYDANGNVDDYTDAGGTVSYKYDAANRVTKLVEPGGTCSGYDLSTLPPSSARCTLFDYDNDNFRTLIRYPSGQKVETTADTSGRMQDLSMTNPSGTEVLGRDYDYDNAGNDSGLMQTVEERQPNSGRTGTDDSTVAYGYNAHNELNEAHVTGDRTHDETYTYSNRGNRLTADINGTTTHYGYNNANQLCWHGPNTGSNGTTSCPSTPTGNNANTYDLNGNQLTNGSTQSYGYNPKNQTSSTTTSSNTQNYTYADFDSTERTQVNSTRTDFGLLGLATQINGTSKFFTRLPDGTLISLRDGAGGSSTNSYYTLDHQQSVLAVTNTAGTTDDAVYTYEAFGKPITATGSAPTNNPYRFHSGLFDTQTGHYKYGTRYYNPTTGRWTQHDPVSGTIDNPGTLNRYTYVGNNPANGSDPTGTISWLDAAGLLGALGEAVAAYESGDPVGAAANIYGFLIGTLVTGVCEFGLAVGTAGIGALAGFAGCYSLGSLAAIAAEKYYESAVFRSAAN